VASNALWGMKKEHAAERPVVLFFRPDATIAGFGAENDLPSKLLMEAFGLQEPADLARKLSDLGLSGEQIAERVQKARAMTSEYGSKNWVKIPIKLALWLVMVIVAFRLMRRSAVTSTVRKGMYLASVLVFGVVLGNEPSPMNTLTDTIALFGRKGIIFPPRAAVLTAFLIIVVLANKFICAWGCQFGTLQDLLFRLNRDGSEQGILGQVKPPFAATNAVRGSLFILFTVLALGWGFDIIAPVNPFRIYDPAAVTAAGGVLLGLLLLAALFVYRPWCHLFCPFGFIGWLAEKASRYKIQVDYETCISCEQCAAACPSTVMGAILKRDRTVPDCFACGTCISACPTGSIAFRPGKRALPPAGKFLQNGRGA
jgi:polyferredoxin